MTTQILGSTLLRRIINNLNVTTSHSLQVLKHTNSFSESLNYLGFNSFAPSTSQKSTTTRAQSELNKDLFTIHSNLSHKKLDCMCHETPDINTIDICKVSLIHRNNIIFNH